MTDDSAEVCRDWCLLLYLLHLKLFLWSLHGRVDIAYVWIACEMSQRASSAPSSG
jgi:hypothetical protein